jgi:hypothetical protein
LKGDEFSRHAISSIALLSGGVPRTINLLCERSLDIARRRGATTVDAPIVRSAARQLDIPVPPTWFTRSRAAVSGAVLLAILVPAAWLCASGLRAKPAAPATAPVGGSVENGNGAQGAKPAAGPVAAAAAIPVLPTGTTPIGTLALADGFTIEVAGFRDVDRASSVIQQLHDAGLPAFHRTDANGLRHFVLVGPYVSQIEVDSVQQTLAAKGFTQTTVRREDAGVLLP